MLTNTKLYGIKSKITKGGFMLKYKALPLLVLIIFLPLSLLGEKIAVVDFKPIGVDPSLVEATTTLLKADLSSYKKFTLVEVVEKVVCEDKECAAEIGFKAKAHKVVYGTVSKLGKKYIIAAYVVEVSTHNIVFQDRIAAASAEDLDITSKRLAKAIATGKKVEKVAEVGIITEEETKEPRRRKSFYTVGGKFGWGMPLGDSYGGVNSLISYDLIGWYETPKFMVELLLGGFSSTGFNIADTTLSTVEWITPEISIFYLFSQGDFCPYAGGGMGMRYMLIEKKFLEVETAVALGINLGGGLIAFRTYDFRILVDARYSLNFADLPSYPGPHHAFQISFGVTYIPTKDRGCGGGGCAPGFGGGGCL